MSTAFRDRFAGRSVAFGVVAYAFAVTMLGTTLPSPLYGIYQEQFGFSQLTITIIFATYAGGVIAALLLFGRLSDEIGRRWTLLPGLAFSAGSAVVFLLADGLAPLLAGRVLSGLSAGIFTGTATATLLDLAAPGRRDRATLTATVANMGGLGCGPLLAGILAAWVAEPLRVPFWAHLALLVPAAVGLWLIAEPSPAPGRLRLQVQALHVPAAVRAAFVRASLAGFAGFAVLGLFTSVAPAFLARELGVTNHALVGLVIFSVFSASTLGQLALSRVPAPRAMPIGLGLLIAGMGLLALGLEMSSVAFVELGGLVAGVGQGLSFRSALNGLQAETPADRRAEVASSFFLVAYIAISIPVIGVGLLADATDLQTAGLVFAAVVAALSVLVLALLARASERRS